MKSCINSRLVPKEYKLDQPTLWQVGVNREISFLVQEMLALCLSYIKVVIMGEVASKEIF